MIELTAGSGVQTRRLCWLVIFTILAFPDIRAQNDTLAKGHQDPWKFDGTFILNINESTFTNWVAGGDNQVAINTIVKPILIYDNKKWTWRIEFDYRHGFQKINSEKVKKSEDVIKIETLAGRYISKYWKFSGLYSFNTQMQPSWDGEKLISAFMAPCYTNLSLGFEYTPSAAFKLYMTPFNGRTTYVLNDTLSARGEFGVSPGKSILLKFGPSILLSYKKEVVKNILVDTKVGYFQNILDGLGDPVVNWDAVISMKVTKIIATTFTFGLFYDPDSKIDIKDQNGNITGNEAKIQFKQTFGFGVNVNW